jgi:hypothetical protein
MLVYGQREQDARSSRYRKVGADELSTSPVPPLTVRLKMTSTRRLLGNMEPRLGVTRS